MQKYKSWMGRKATKQPGVDCMNNLAFCVIKYSLNVSKHECFIVLCLIACRKQYENCLFRCRFMVSSLVNIVLLWSCCFFLSALCWATAFDTSERDAVQDILVYGSPYRKQWATPIIRTNCTLMQRGNEEAFPLMAGVRGGHFVESVVITFLTVSWKRLFSESRERLVHRGEPGEHLLHGAGVCRHHGCFESACLTWRARRTSFVARTGF